MWINILTVAALISPLLPPTACQSCTRSEVACGGHCATPCDGFVECDNNADETSDLCSNVRCTGEENPGDAGSFTDLFAEVTNNAQTQFRCNYGGCISNTFVCNGHRDCWDGSDETRELCSSKTCSRRKFQCDYGGCIGRLWKCNGLVNCMDGSDETAATCRSQTCNVSKFKCAYGGCIHKNKKCNGVEDCNDGSDETKELCGESHTLAPSTTIASPPPPPPVTQRPPPVTQRPPPVTQRPPPVTQPPPPPVTPDIIVPDVSEPLGNGCGNQGLCPCQYPYTHFCVPCNSMETCSRIDEVGVCSIEPAAGPNHRISVHVLACGVQPVINIAGLVRQHGDSTCGSGKKVPVLSIVTADCWGTTTLMQCQSDGMWHPYGGLHTSPLPASHLCQPQAINSPICGNRPRYVKTSETQYSFQSLSRKPQWPWLVGLMRNGRYSCAATIITPQYLITAAHCLTRTKVSRDLEDPRNFRVQRLNHMGHITTKEFVSQMFVYPGYRGGTSPTNDLALVKVEREILFSEEVFPACVLNQEFPREKIAATFERTKQMYEWNLILQSYDTRCLAPSDRCSSSLNIDTGKFCGIDTESQRFLPEGSSGGPYLVNLGSDAEERWTVAGVVSSRLSEGDLCHHPFTIFTNLQHFWTWVDNCVHKGECA